MQLTRFDRWLQTKFLHEIHVYSLRPPAALPAGVFAQELPEAPGRKYRHEFVTRDPRLADELITEFKTHNQMFTTRVVNRSTWYTPLVAPEGKSVTWWCAWLVISAIGLFVAARAVQSLWSDPTFQKNFGEAIEILKG